MVFSFSMPRRPTISSNALKYWSSSPISAAGSTVSASCVEPLKSANRIVADWM
jgi:hypothetical protein